MASLPYADVDSSLRALAGQAEGFGRLSVGGLHGPVYCVSTLAGSLSLSLLIDFSFSFLFFLSLVVVRVCSALYRNSRCVPPIRLGL